MNAKCMECGRETDVQNSNVCDECYRHWHDEDESLYHDPEYDDGEPTGSCEWCDSNVYDGSDLCDQCEYLSDHGGETQAEESESEGQKRFKP